MEPWWLYKLEGKEKKKADTYKNQMSAKTDTQQSASDTCKVEKLEWMAGDIKTATTLELHRNPQAFSTLRGRFLLCCVH